MFRRKGLLSSTGRGVVAVDRIALPGDVQVEGPPHRLAERGDASHARLEVVAGCRGGRGRIVGRHRAF